MSSRYVFTPEWISEQKRKYAHCPKHARPRQYRFWTSDECAVYRDSIEQWVGHISPESRTKVIPRLRKPEQFKQTYNELAVGESLRHMGHIVEYEVELQGLTPDWLVRSSDACAGLIIEVVSSNPPQERERCNNGWDGFRHRLDELPGNVLLYVQPPFDDGDGNPVAPPSGPRQKQIVSYVREWLETSPPKGQGYAIDGIVIRFVGRDPDLDHVSCAIGCLPFWVDAAPLRESVKEKAGKYRGLVQELQLPFVVCVIPDFETARGLDELEVAVFGDECCRMSRGSHGDHRQEDYRQKDGVFSKYTTLSAVILGEWNNRDLVHTVVHNPIAAFPLELSVFPLGTAATEDEHRPAPAAVPDRP
jgi:hypothetical protein